MADAAFLVTCLVWGGSAALLGTFPFNLVMTVITGLFLGQALFMLNSLRSPSEVGYFDHLFFFIPILLYLGKANLLVFAPVVVLWVFLLFRPPVRKYFSLRKKGPDFFRLPEAVPMYWAVLLCILARFLTDEGFPFLRGKPGALFFLTGTSFPPMLFLFGAVLGVGAIKGWKWSYVVTPFAVCALLVSYLGMGAVVAGVFCLFWAFPETRVHFGRAEQGIPAVFPIILAWLICAGLVFSLLPAGWCARHGTPMYLYPAWRTPEIMASHQEDIAYRITNPQAANRIQTGCSACERAIVHRKAGAECRQNLRTAWEKIRPVLLENGLASASFEVNVTRNGVVVVPAKPGLGEKIKAALAEKPGFPCPFEAGIGSPTFGIGQLPEGYVFKPGLEGYPEGNPEARCLYCEAYGL